MWVVSGDMGYAVLAGVRGGGVLGKNIRKGQGSVDKKLDNYTRM